MEQGTGEQVDHAHPLDTTRDKWERGLKKATIVRYYQTKGIIGADSNVTTNAFTGNITDLQLIKTKNYSNQACENVKK